MERKGLRQFFYFWFVNWVDSTPPPSRKTQIIKRIIIKFKRKYDEKFIGGAQ